MKPFNPELNKDILTLKTLSIQKDKTEFHKAVCDMMTKHGISRSTIYRELRKDTPGSYTRPDHSAPRRKITEKEIAMVKELLLKKVSVMDIGRIMEAETGDRYTWDRIDEIRKIVDMRIKGSGGQLDSPIPTSFGQPIKCLVEQALNLNKIAPNAYVEFNAGDEKYSLNYQEARDIALICANAIVRSRHGITDDVTYMQVKLRMLFREKIRTAPVQTTVKEYLNLKGLLSTYANECEKERWMQKLNKTDDEDDDAGE